MTDTVVSTVENAPAADVSPPPGVAAPTPGPEALVSGAAPPLIDPVKPPGGPVAPVYKPGDPQPPLPHESVLQIVYQRLLEIQAQQPPGSTLITLLDPVISAIQLGGTVLPGDMLGKKAAERIAYVNGAWSRGDTAAIDEFLAREPREPTAYWNYASWIRAQMTPAVPVHPVPAV